MHDAVPYYYDTSADDSDEQPTIALPRVSTSELTMQVAVLGRWHRRTPDLSATACGILYHSQFAPTRREELCGALCSDCFTKFELSLGKERDKKEEP